MRLNRLFKGAVYKQESELAVLRSRGLAAATLLDLLQAGSAGREVDHPLQLYHRPN